MDVNGVCKIAHSSLLLTRVPRGELLGFRAPFAPPSRIVVSTVTRISENFVFLRSLDPINVSLTIVCMMVTVQKERTVHCLGT